MVELLVHNRRSLPDIIAPTYSHLQKLLLMITQDDMDNSSMVAGKRKAALFIKYSHSFLVILLPNLLLR